MNLNSGIWRMAVAMGLSGTIGFRRDERAIDANSGFLPLPDWRTGPLGMAELEGRLAAMAARLAGCCSVP